MSVFTTELRFICESLYDNKSHGFNSVNDIITNVAPKIFNFDYPIYDISYKSILETKIIKHYYTREIGLETYGLWQLFLDKKMNEIMPYYNQLYKSALIEFNPMYDTDLTTHNDLQVNKNQTDNTDFTSNQKSSGTTDDTGDRTKNMTDNLDHTNMDKFWDTPQNTVSPLTESQYMTNARDISGNDNRTINETENTENKGAYENTIDTANKTGYVSDIKNLEEYWNTVVGKSGGKSYSQLLNEFRSTFLNIDMMIIKELADLFMNVYEGV